MKVEDIKFWHIYSDKKGRNFKQVLSIGENNDGERFALVTDGVEGDNGSIYWSKCQPKWVLLKRLARWAKIEIS